MFVWLSTLFLHLAGTGSAWAKEESFRLLPDVKDISGKEDEH